MIEAVQIVPLKRIADELGAVLHMLRSDSPLFQRFGEVYFSLVNPKAVKAWKRHRLMTQHLAVPIGRIRLVMYDDREASPSRGQVEVLELGEDVYSLVRIPPLLWYGFQGLSSTPALIANCADLPHDPAEVERADSSDQRIPYRWV